MLGIFAVETAVLSSSVSDRAELSGILDLLLNKNALFKNAFAMEPWFSQSKNINRRCILSKLRMGLKLTVETDRHKGVSIHTGSRTLPPPGHFPSVTYIWLGLRLGTLTLTLTLTQETGE